MNNLESLSLLSQAFNILFALKAGLDLANHFVQGHEDTLLLRVAISQTHLLDLDLARGNFVITKENGKRDAVGFGGLELCGDLGLDLVKELGLRKVRFSKGTYMDRTVELRSDG